MEFSVACANPGRALEMEIHSLSPQMITGCLHGANGDTEDQEGASLCPHQVSGPGVTMAEEIKEVMAQNSVTEVPRMGHCKGKTCGCDIVVYDKKYIFGL